MNKKLIIIASVLVLSTPILSMAQTATPTATPTPTPTPVTTVAAPSPTTTTSQSADSSSSAAPATGGSSTTGAPATGGSTVTATPSPTPTPTPSTGGSSTTAGQTPPPTGGSSTTAGQTPPPTGGSSTTAGQTPPPTGGSSTTAGSPTPSPSPATGGGSNNTGSSFNGSGGSSGGFGSVPLAVGGYSGITASSCPLLATGLMAPGMNNNPVQVAKLQAFLRNSEKLNVTVNGIFDAQTEAAVKAFQTKYVDSVMGPWGASQASGNVYITTVKKINELACKAPLTLNSSELAIIQAYQAHLANAASSSDQQVIGMNTGTTSATLDVMTNDNDNTAAVGNVSIWSRFWNFIVSLFR